MSWYSSWQQVASGQWPYPDMTNPKPGDCATGKGTTLFYDCNYLLSWGKSHPLVNPLKGLFGMLSGFISAVFQDTKELAFVRQ